MAIALTDLLWRLEADVTPRDGVPTRAQMEAVLSAGVRDYSRRCPLRRLGTLSVVDGTADYALPDDFIRWIGWRPVYSEEGVIYSGSGMMVPLRSKRPYSTGVTEAMTIAGLTLTLIPTPTYTLDRDYYYAAGHTLTDGEYPDMTAEGADLVLIWARASALRLLASSVVVAGEMVEYQIGDERVKRRPLADALRLEARDLDREYLDRVRQLNERTGQRAQFPYGRGRPFGGVM